VKRKSGRVACFVWRVAWIGDGGVKIAEGRHACAWSNGTKGTEGTKGQRR
jgi:hypothetical protein